jgi:hypothetical protein
MAGAAACSITGSNELDAYLGATETGAAGWVVAVSVNNRMLPSTVL